MAIAALLAFNPFPVGGNSVGLGVAMAAEEAAPAKEAAPAAAPAKEAAPAPAKLPLPRKTRFPIWRSARKTRL